MIACPVQRRLVPCWPAVGSRLAGSHRPTCPQRGPSPNRSFVDLRCRSARGARHACAVRSAVLALPTQSCQSILRSRRQEAPARATLQEQALCQALALTRTDPLVLTKADPRSSMRENAKSRDGCKRPNAALTAIRKRTCLYAASRVRFAGFAALDPAPRRKSAAGARQRWVTH